jgi:hypothetical protein
MKTNRPTTWFTAILLFSCWLALDEPGVRAQDNVGAKDKIKALQKQRLEVAKKARDYLAKQFQSGIMPKGGFNDTNTFMLRLLELDKLVFQDRLDLCEGKAARIKVVQETIAEFEPVVKLFEQRYKAGTVDPLTFDLAQLHLLGLKIALEKTKQETGGP